MQVETMKEWLDIWKQDNREVEIGTVSGKIYRGRINTVGKEYFRLRENPNTYISIDKVESITQIV